MLYINHVLPQILHAPRFAFGRQAGQVPTPFQPGQISQPQRLYGPSAEDESLAKAIAGPEIKRDLSGASLGQLMDALSAAIIRDTQVSGDHVLLALAEAAVLEHELSGRFPRRWRVQQALNALLKMGPHVTAALAAVLEHPSAIAHISRMFSD